MARERRADAGHAQGPRGTGYWTNAELHAAMQGHFSAWGDVPQWKVWLFHAQRHEYGPGLLGIMFDQHGKQRQGCAVFYAGPLGGQDALRRRMQLYTCVHELGHCFNLFHSFHKSYMTPPQPNRPTALSWMNYPQNYPSGEAAFWSAFAFQFDTLETTHLRHGYRNAVVLGGDPFGAGAALEAAGDFVDPEEDWSGLRFELRVDRSFLLGEPVVVELKLSREARRRAEVHPHLHPADGFVTVAVQRPSPAGTCGDPECTCASDADCDDGIYCNGAETCVDCDVGCRSGPSPCTSEETCDEDSASCSVIDCGPRIPFFRDADGDSHGAIGDRVDACVAPPGYVRGGGDCDDANPARHPGQSELCDGAVDDDCDLAVDEGCACASGAMRACGLDVGVCYRATQRCIDGIWDRCPSSPPAPESGRAVVVLSPRALRELAEQSVWIPLFAIAHEIGHHINGHLTRLATGFVPSSQLRQLWELSADATAARLLRRVGATLDDVLQSIRALRHDPSDRDHPSLQRRLDRVRVTWRATREEQSVERLRELASAFALHVLGHSVPRQ